MRVPNGVVDWNAKDNLGTLNAIRPIAEGEEITICYVPDLFFDGIDVVNHELQTHYCFTCTWPMCPDPPAQERSNALTRRQQAAVDVYDAARMYRHELRNLHTRLPATELLWADVFPNDVEWTDERVISSFRYVLLLQREGICDNRLADAKLVHAFMKYCLAHDRSIQARKDAQSSYDWAESIYKKCFGENLIEDRS